MSNELKSPCECRPCKDTSPHEPHVWTLAAIDGDYYNCPGIADDSSLIQEGD